MFEFRVLVLSAVALGSTVFFTAPVAADEEKIAAAKAAMTVRPRLDVLEEHGNYPCTECHDNETQKANPSERELEDEHEDVSLRHGGDRFWCLTCHNQESRDSLIDLKGRKVSFDDSYKVCMQCHSSRTEDFYRGGHGKRLANWAGEREVYACVECHDPHSPAIKPRQPVALPKLRKGLPVPAVHVAAETLKPWDKFREERKLPAASVPEKKEAK